MFKGTERRTTVEVRVDDALVTTWTSSGTTDAPQSIALTGTSGSVIDITGDLEETEWLSIVEVRFCFSTNSSGTDRPPWWLSLALPAVSSFRTNQGGGWEDGMPNKGVQHCLARNGF